jgi:nitroreductase
MTCGVPEPSRASDIHPALRRRTSPTAFDERHSLGEHEVELLLEAARWAPSAGNSQPWSFLPARRGTDLHELVVRRLAPSSARWAPDAACLVVNAVHRFVEDTDWAYSEFSDYDLGQAVAHMTLQAEAMDLACRQFRAFDLEALTADLGVAPGWELVSITAVGRSARESDGHRERRSVSDLRSAAFSVGARAGATASPDRTSGPAGLPSTAPA